VAALAARDTFDVLPFEEASPLLRLRLSGGFDRAEPDLPGAITFDLHPWLAASLAVALPGAIDGVDQATAARWGVEPAALRTIAEGNLARLAAPTDRTADLRGIPVRDVAGDA